MIGFLVRCTDAKDVKYRLVSDNGGYAVGDDGSVWSRMTVGSKPTPTAAWHRLKPSRNKLRGDYLYVNVGRGNPIAVHLLVMSAFVGPRPADLETLHNNGNKHDCRLFNLRYGTPQDNADDRKKHGTACGPIKPAVGSSHVNAKLDEDKVALILSSNLVSSAALARKFGVSETAIKYIRQRKTWKHVKPQAA